MNKTELTQIRYMAKKIMNNMLDAESELNTLFEYIKMKEEED